MNMEGLLSQAGVKGRKGAMLPTHVVFVALVALTIAVSAGSAAYLTSTQSQALSQPGGVSIGGVRFGSQWQYAGNVTLSGSQSVCYVLRLPCAANPQNEAEKLVSSNGSVAYVETANGCGPQTCVSWTIVLMGNSLYCVTPKSNIQSEPLCPSLIT